MKKGNIYLSTVAADSVQAAKKYGVNLELAEYCTAWNMDDEFVQTDAAVREKLEGIRSCVLHAPFNELFPCAIDRKARALAKERYLRAIALAKDYGAVKVVVHGGYNPQIYFPVWYTEQSVLFWKEFLTEAPGVEIVLENVLETDPQWLVDIVKGVNDERLRLCLDVGHVNAYSKVTAVEWLKRWAPYISHFHIHNNDGGQDQHNGLMDGTVPMKEFLALAEELCPNATFTLEVMEAEPSLSWLAENGLI